MRRDPTNDIHMGECAERCAEEHGFTRRDQDDHALESHRRAGEAARAGFTAEVCQGEMQGSRCVFKRHALESHLAAVGVIAVCNCRRAPIINACISMPWSEALILDSLPQAQS